MGERDRELETIKCPACGANTRTKVKKDTALVFFPLYCQKCKKELRITWVDGKIAIDKIAEKYSAESNTVIETRKAGGRKAYRKKYGSLPLVNLRNEEECKTKGM